MRYKTLIKYVYYTKATVKTNQRVYFTSGFFRKQKITILQGGVKTKCSFSAQSYNFNADYYGRYRPL